VTIFHSPKKTGLRGGIRLAGHAIKFAEKHNVSLETAVQRIGEKRRLDFEQRVELLKLARERRSKGL
jgi:hypothetical protein